MRLNKIKNVTERSFLSEHYYKLVIILLLLGVLHLPGTAMAWPQGIKIEWQFPSSAEVAEFRLYQDQYKVVCSTDKPNATSMECTVDFADCESVFSLTAYYSNGDESPHSPPYSFDACQKQKSLEAMNAVFSLLLMSDEVQ